MSPSPKEVSRVNWLTLSTEIEADTAGITGAGIEGRDGVGSGVGVGVLIGILGTVDVKGADVETDVAVGAHAVTTKITTNNAEIDRNLIIYSPKSVKHHAISMSPPYKP